MLFSEGRCVGGSTVVNGGMSWRTPGPGAAAMGGRGRMSPRSASGTWSRTSQGGVEDLGGAAGSRDDRPGHAAAEGRGGRQGLEDHPQPAQPAALRRHQQLHQRLPDGREALHAGDQHPPCAWAWCPAVRGLPGGADHQVRGHRHGHRGPVRPAGRAARPAPDRARRGRRRRRRRGADPGAAGPFWAAVGVRAAGPQPHHAPQREGDRFLRRGSHRLEGRAPGLPGARVRRRRHLADGGQPAAVTGRDGAARLTAASSAS